jgi:hypothetical protein
LTISQSWGASATGGVDALLRPDTARALGPAEEEEANADLRRHPLRVRLGYGLAVFRDRFMVTPEIGLRLSATSREYHLGCRLGLVRHDRMSLEFTVKATRRENSSDDRGARQGIGLHLQMTMPL